MCDQQSSIVWGGDLQVTFKDSTGEFVLLLRPQGV